MQKIGELSKLKTSKCLTVKGKQLALFVIKGKVYCIDNTCPHLGGPLCKGDVKDHIVACPWHGSTFDVRTGKVKGLPAKEGVKKYKVKIKGDEVYIDI